MDRFLELCRIGVLHLIALFIKQRPVAISFEDGSEIPAMAVVIGKLGVLKLGVIFPDLTEKFAIAPKSPLRGFFRVVARNFTRLVVTDDLFRLNIEPQLDLFRRDIGS